MLTVSIMSIAMLAASMMPMIVFAAVMAIFTVSIAMFVASMAMLAAFNMSMAMFAVSMAMFAAFMMPMAMLVLFMAMFAVSIAMLAAFMMPMAMLVLFMAMFAVFMAMFAVSIAMLAAFMMPMAMFALFMVMFAAPMWMTASPLHVTIMFWTPCPTNLHITDTYDHFPCRGHSRVTLYAHKVPDYLKRRLLVNDLAILTPITNHCVLARSHEVEAAFIKAPTVRISSTEAHSPSWRHIYYIIIHDMSLYNMLHINRKIKTNIE